MPYIDVYLGTLEGFDWHAADSDPSTTNVPEPILGFDRLFKGDRLTIFGEIIDGVKGGQLEGAQVDWGGWVAKLTKQQLLDFAETWYERYPDPEGSRECLRRLESLDDHGTYGLVAMET